MPSPPYLPRSKEIENGNLFIASIKFQLSMMGQKP